MTAIPSFFFFFFLQCCIKTIHGKCLLMTLELQLTIIFNTDKSVTLLFNIPFPSYVSALVYNDNPGQLYHLKFVVIFQTVDP